MCQLILKTNQSTVLLKMPQIKLKLTNSLRIYHWKTLFFLLFRDLSNNHVCTQDIFRVQKLLRKMSKLTASQI